MIAKTSYDNVAKFLHWTIAIGILFMIALGWYMGEVPREDPNKFAYYQMHKSIGITIMLLSLFRLYWRLRHPPPPLPATMPAFEKFAAEALVIVFYLLIIGIPMIGWIMVSTSPLNLPTLLYGIIPWPHFPLLPALESKKEIHHVAEILHGFMAYSVLALLCLHIGGALKHHFISRDDILTRMAPNSLGGFLNWVRNFKR